MAATIRPTYIRNRLEIQAASRMLSMGTDMMNTVPLSVK